MVAERFSKRMKIREKPTTKRKALSTTEVRFGFLAFTDGQAGQISHIDRQQGQDAPRGQGQQAGGQSDEQKDTCDIGQTS